MAVLTGKNRRIAQEIVFKVFLYAFVLVWLLPAIWSISMSLRPETSLRRSTEGLLPIPFAIENYAHMLRSSRIPRWFYNSALVTVTRTLLVLFVNILAAYAFARIPFRGSALLFALAMAGLMVPSQVTFIPNYLLITSLGWQNTYNALVFPGLASSFGVFLLSNFFKGIPKEIEEAATLDGAGRLAVLFNVVIPLSVPAIATLGIFTFLGTWNDFLWPLIAISRMEMMTITVGLPLLAGNWGSVEFLGRTLAGAWIAAIPTVIFFLAFQKHLIRGISLEGGF
ncbi:MAG: carbohydrate ABC transporter permease [Anaerolineae bacterium]|jgi:multiple sugar transport system permease protein